MSNDPRRTKPPSAGDVETQRTFLRNAADGARPDDHSRWERIKKEFHLEDLHKGGPPKVVELPKDDFQLVLRVLAPNEDVGIVRGFRPRGENLVVVNRDEESKLGGTRLHEMMHVAGSPSFATRFSQVRLGGDTVLSLNEGATELFTRTVFDDPERRTDVYVIDMSLALALKDVVGEQVLRKAYYRGDEGAMQQIDSALATERAKLQAGADDYFLKLMDGEGSLEQVVAAKAAETKKEDAAGRAGPAPAAGSGATPPKGPPGDGGGTA